MLVKSKIIVAIKYVRIYYNYIIKQHILMFRSKSSFANLVVAALYCLTGLVGVRANSENEEVVTPGSDPKCITTMSLPSDGSNAATTG